MQNQVDNVNELTGVPDDDVLEVIHSVTHLARSRWLRGGAGVPHELSPMEGRTLGFFVRHPGSTQSDLATHSGRDKGQLARLIGGMRDKGLLEARPDDQDRRVIRLYPTAVAQALHDDLQQQRRQLAMVAVAGMSAAQRRHLLELLKVVRSNLQEPT